MKIFFSILTLFVVSVCAGQLKPKPLEFKENKRYGYIYIGRVLTGIPSSSSLYSGTTFGAAVLISHVVNENGIHINTMKLTSIGFSQVIEEITNPINFGGWSSINDVNTKPLELTVQYHVNNVTNRFEWIEVDKRDEPWSINIKKAIIEMFLVDIAGKQLEINTDHEYSQTRSSFDIYEATLKGECETMYQVVNELPKSVNGLSGIEQFYWKVMKTRNYQNCNNAFVSTQNNWARKGCAAYCKQTPAFGENRMNNYDSFDKSQCSCDDIQVKPLDQQSTSTYFIESMDYPHIISAESNSKITFDNHGTRFVSYTNQTLKFMGTFFGGPVDYINKDNAIRISNLTFTLYPYTDSSALVNTHEIPIYNLLVPINNGPAKDHLLTFDTNLLLTSAAETIIGMSKHENKNRPKIARFMTRITQNLAHLSLTGIMNLYLEGCIISEKELYTNSLNSVRRQLFLDAISHVGTQSVAQWLDKVINLSPDSNGLFPMEMRQVIETLPLNVYAPTNSLINLLEKKINSYASTNEWDEIAAFVVTYGKLIAKACPNPEFPINIEIKKNSTDEECTDMQTIERMARLGENLITNPSTRAKVLFAQALAYSGKDHALHYLMPYIEGQFKNPQDASERIFLRSTIIYSLHHFVPIKPERIRSLVSSIFSIKTEPYEIRLAAFTVFMSTMPKKHELGSIAVTLRSETNLQIISMVRSVLEETANLTQPCHKPLARAAREIIATLPEVNINGIYSQASYNEWYSTDKSTGFFANGRFVTNNISYIPRHGYLSLGSHWKSMSNSWLSFAFQQNGLETALKKLLDTVSVQYEFDPTINELWRDRGVISGNEDEFMLKLFIRVHGQTSLFTMDEYTLKNTFKQFVRIMRNFVSDTSNNEVDFNWVRFFMPATYIDVVPTTIGLPIAAIKQNPQIVSLRLTKSDLQPSHNKNSISFKVAPQIFASSDSSLSVFNQGLQAKKNYGVHSSKKLNLFVPLNLNFEWKSEDKLHRFTYTIKPVFDKINLHSSNTNFAFIARSQMGFSDLSSLQEKRIIQSLVPAYTHPLTQLKSPEFGMNLNINMSTERPWFVDFTQIPCEGTVAWLFEKYNEMNQFNHNINLTLVQNDQFPSTGISGSLSYEQTIDFDFNENIKSSTKGIRKVGQELVKLYKPRVPYAALFIQALDASFITLGHPEPTTYNSTLYMVHDMNYLINWYRFNSTLDSVNNTLWERFPRRLVIDGKLERSVLPRDPKLQPEKSEEIVGNYIANISWAHDVTTEQLDTEILINGELKRVAPDPVIPEMDPRSWFHEQCEKDIKNGNATNYACEQLYAQQAYFNVITGKIEFREVEKPVRESIRMVYSELKRSLISYWKPWSTVSIKKNEGERDAVNFEAAFSNLIYKRPVINLFVQTPNELVNFTKLFVPVAPFPTLIPTEYLKASSLPKDQTCTVMKDSIRTFDNVTYYTWIDECEFVAAMDCAEESKQFAVTVKGKAGKRSVRVYTPLKTFFKVWDVKKDVASLTVYGVDGVQLGKDYLVEAGKPALHVSANGIEEAHRVFMQDGVVNIILPSENVRVAFDGHYLKITTSPFYLGKTCGLCGNQNQEFTSEFLDPKMNDLASNLTAFRDSYSLHGCTDPNPCHKNGCELEKPVAHYRRRNYIASPKKTTKTSNPYGRTIVERRDNLDCFSKYPQMACKENEKAAQTVSMPIHWVCFGQEHALHKQWIEQADRRVIYEAATFETTESKIYEAPTECDKESVRGI